MKYKENQRFRRTDIWLLLIALIGGTIYRFTDLFILHGSGRERDLYLFLLSMLVLLGLSVILLSMRLVTKIDEKGIRFQCYPWHYRTHKVRWEEIAECRIIQMPLGAQLSGWNVSIGKPELFYSFTGRNGVELHLKDGRYLFIGSRQPEDLAMAIREYMPS